MPEETYLGNGLYVSFNGQQIRLRALRLGDDNIVYLNEPQFRELFKYCTAAFGADKEQP